MTNNEVIIEAKDLSVGFLVQRQGVNSVKDFVINMGVKNPFEKKSVLKNFNLQVKRGECLGILGRNGCGKSTFLRTVAGVMKPDAGSLVVNGEVAPLMALGVGLEPELSGYENIKLVCTLMGYSQKETKQMIDPIIKFSELTSDQIEMQVKKYSSGMMARLAFSTAVAKTPDILIIDEALAVGDLGFIKKSARRIDEIKDAGSTILYVSHHLEEIKRICTKACYFSDGKVAKIGDVDEVCAYYEEQLNN